PVATMGNFYADAQQTNLNLEEQAHALFQQFGGFDVIHAHDWLVAFAAASLKRIHKTPLLATIHATERGRGRGYLGGETSHAINGTEWWLTYEAWRVITASLYMADEVKSYFQVPRDKIDVVPNGVDPAPFDALEGVDLSNFRARWARPDERIVFSVGRLVQEKGAHLIVEAAPRVLARNANTRFIIAGTGGMGEYLKRRVAELGIGDRVNVAGFVSDADRNRLLKVSDAAVFPSIYEPFGIVALEAMAARCPVVVSSVGGLGEVVQHEKTGITVYPDNIDSLAWGILETLNHPAVAAARAEKAYRIVKTDYSWDHVAALTIEVYERIIRERAKTDW
ncbi:MAG: glycosyltransferase family 4 protein, partial [Acidobacteriota bacterium]